MPFTRLAAPSCAWWRESPLHQRSAAAVPATFCKHTLYAFQHKPNDHSQWRFAAVALRCHEQQHACFDIPGMSVAM